MLITTDEANQTLKSGSQIQENRSITLSASNPRDRKLFAGIGQFGRPPHGGCPSLRPVVSASYPTFTLYDVGVLGFGQGDIRDGYDGNEFNLGKADNSVCRPIFVSVHNNNKTPCFGRIPPHLVAYFQPSYLATIPSNHLQHRCTIATMSEGDTQPPNMVVKEAHNIGTWPLNLRRRMC